MFLTLMELYVTMCKRVYVHVCGVCVSALMVSHERGPESL